MRINRFIAASTGVSRRAADKLVQDSKVFINGLPAQLSDHVTSNDKVIVNKQQIFLPLEFITIVLNKPVGYVCSREGQGSKTIYDLLPENLHHLKPVGRLDKDSSGLLIMTDNGQLAHELTHPKFQKDKVYEIRLNVLLKSEDAALIEKTGVKLDDGISRLKLTLNDHEGKNWLVTMQEGRNRQIRRTFSALNYTVKKLHRTQFGDCKLGELPIGKSRLTF